MRRHRCALALGEDVPGFCFAAQSSANAVSKLPLLRGAVQRPMRPEEYKLGHAPLAERRPRGALEGRSGGHKTGYSGPSSDSESEGRGAVGGGPCSEAAPSPL